MIVSIMIETPIGWIINRLIKNTTKNNSAILFIFKNTLICIPGSNRTITIRLERGEPNH